MFQDLAHQSSLIENYSILLDEYKRLRRDYEEERDAREKYKGLAKDQDRDPFVLVLVDGDSYIFNDELISGGTEGGRRAAELLYSTVQVAMRAQGMDDCRVMVRIYANLAGLSKTASKLNLCGDNTRSLAHFVASFNRSNEHFDFVDAGWHKESADLKIRALFNQFVNNRQCQHIVFAGCHDAGYLADLKPYANSRCKITLIKNHSFHPDFAKLGFVVEELPGLFRSTTLRHPSKIPTSTPNPSSVTTGSVGKVSTPTKVCKFFQKSICKHGTECRSLHVLARPNRPKSPQMDPVKFRPSPIKSKKGTNPSDAKSTSGDSFRNETGTDLCGVAGETLPKHGFFPSNQILLNKAGWRLDCSLPKLDQSDHREFLIHVAQNKASGIGRLCNIMHLQGECPEGDNCTFDHRPITPAVREGLRLVSRLEPCPRKGACRRPVCPYGHICQKRNCKMRGGRGHCKFDLAFHTTDLIIAKRVTIIRAGSETTTSTAPSVEPEPPLLIEDDPLTDDEDDAEYLSAPSLPDLFGEEEFIEEKTTQWSPSLSHVPQ